MPRSLNDDNHVNQSFYQVPRDCGWRGLMNRCSMARVWQTTLNAWVPVG